MWEPWLEPSHDLQNYNVTAPDEGYLIGDSGLLFHWHPFPFTGHFFGGFGGFGAVSDILWCRLRPGSAPRTACTHDPPAPYWPLARL